MTGDNYQTALKFFNGDYQENLNGLRRKILVTLGALVTVEREQPGCGESARMHRPSSRLFYAALKDICSSVLERDHQHEDTSELLLRAMASCIFSDGEEAKKKPPSTDWMPECWSVISCISGGLTTQDTLELLHNKELPEALRARQGGTMMHLGSARHQFDADVMRAISSPLAARVKDCEGRLPLHWAAAQSQSVAMLDYLLALNPGATKVQDKSGKTPIALCVLRSPFPEQVAMVKHLAQADPESCAITSTLEQFNLFHCFAVAAGSCKGGEAKDLEALFEALLEVVPMGYLLEADSSAQTPLHGLCRHLTTPPSIVTSMIQACPEAVRYLDSSGELPVNCALHSSSVANIEMLIDAYPEGVDLVDIIRHHNDMLRIIKSYVARFPESVKKLRGRLEDSPLNYACAWGNTDIVKFLYDKHPSALQHFSASGRLSLHITIEYYKPTNTSSPHISYEEVVRFLIRHYPEAVNMKRIFADDEDNDDDDDDDDGVVIEGEERISQTPIELAIEKSLPTSIQRLMLRACPQADEQRWRQLNYEPRREAMFIAFAAISRQRDENTFVWQLRRLMLLDKDMSLLKHVISYL